jgi:acyl-coenzyme A thioesterase PaaI-like protein
MKPPAWLFKFLLNLWPPFLGAGIRVKRLATDFSDIEVRLKLGFSNRNYVGTHFGGSLYAMTDPFFMLMLMRQLGRDYYVWDKSGSIDYIKPGCGTVRARFRLEPGMLEDIRRRTAAGDKYLPQLQVDIVDQQGELVARVFKTLYIKRKKK